MANGSQPQGPWWGSMAQDFLQKNLTKVGVIGGMGYFALHMIIATSWHDRLDSLSYLFLMLIPAGAAFRAKRAADMTATAAASATIERAMIANAVTPANVNVVPTSPDSTIQREIIKQLNGGGGNGKNNGETHS